MKKFLKTRRTSVLVVGISMLITIAALVYPHYMDGSTTATTTPSIHCVGANQNFQCSKKRFEVLTREMGPKVALENIKQQYTYIPQVVSDCHQLMHVIGNTAVDVHGGNITKAFLDGDSFCWSGYYHGAVERAVQNIGESQFMASADMLCASIPGKERYSFDYYNCVHGLGHGIMAVTKDEVFKSLAMCDALSGEWERKSCYGGVFMENVMVDNRNHFSKYLKKEDLMYPCNAVDTKYKEQCYLMQSSYALSQNGYNFAETFKLCANVDVDFRDICGQSIGRDASGNSVSNVERTKNTCLLGIDLNQQKNCVIGAVKDFISYFHGGDQAHQLCLALPENLKETCFQTRESYLKVL